MAKFCYAQFQAQPTLLLEMRIRLGKFDGDARLKTSLCKDFARTEAGRDTDTEIRRDIHTDRQHAHAHTQLFGRGSASKKFEYL